MSADASSYGLGAVLLQRQGEKLAPIAFASHKLTSAERNYAQIEKECLASVWACEKFSKYLIGLDKIELWTDHKPLVPLMTSKDLDKAPVRCQRLLMRLLRFNANVSHKPGRELVIADALSRNPVQHRLTEKEVLQEEEVERHVSTVQASWPVSDSRIEQIRQATIQDSVLTEVINYVINGWPNVKAVPRNLHTYYEVRSGLAVIEGLLTYENRIVIPTIQQQDILTRLHESHQGLTKCRDNAHRSVWWPGLSQDLKKMIESCSTCAENRPANRPEPLKPTPLPDRPWQKIGADLFTVQGKDYLVAVDYYSRWIEVKYLRITTSAEVIKQFKQIFASQGYPDVIISDNGPQFASAEFKAFGKDFDITLTTSSPYYPQGNGAAESAVKIAKKIVCQSSPEIALLNYRTTPHSSTGVSPAMALMGRELKTRAPVLPRVLLPQPPRDAEIRDADRRTKLKYKQQYDKHNGVRSLPYLECGDRVLLRTSEDKKWEKPSVVVSADAQNRTYLVNTPTGVKRRNRAHLQRVPETPEPIEPTGSAQAIAAQVAVPQPVHVPPAALVQPAEPKVAETSPEPQSVQRATRSSSGVALQKPARFRDD